MKKLPKAVTSGELEVAGITLKYQILTDGQRIIEKKGFDKLLNYLAGGGTITVEDAEEIDKFVRGEVGAVA